MELMVVSRNPEVVTEYGIFIGIAITIRILEQS